MATAVVLLVSLLKFKSCRNLQLFTNNLFWKNENNKQNEGTVEALKCALIYYYTTDFLAKIQTLPSNNISFHPMYA